MVARGYRRTLAPPAALAQLDQRQIGREHWAAAAASLGAPQLRRDRSRTPSAHNCISDMNLALQLQRKSRCRACAIPFFNSARTRCAGLLAAPARCSRDAAIRRGVRGHLSRDSAKA
jgi:hypothetical protein